MNSLAKKHRLLTRLKSPFSGRCLIAREFIHGRIAVGYYMFKLLRSIIVPLQDWVWDEEGWRAETQHRPYGLA